MRRARHAGHRHIAIQKQERVPLVSLLAVLCCDGQVRGDDRLMVRMVLPFLCPVGDGQRGRARPVDLERHCIRALTPVPDGLHVVRLAPIRLEVPLAIDVEHGHRRCVPRAG